MMIDERDCGCDYVAVAVAVEAVGSVDDHRRTGGGRWRQHCFGGYEAWRGQQEEEDEAAVTQID